MVLPSTFQPNEEKGVLTFNKDNESRYERYNKQPMDNNKEEKNWNRKMKNVNRIDHGSFMIKKKKNHLEMEMHHS